MYECFGIFYSLSSIYLFLRTENKCIFMKCFIVSFENNRICHNTIYYCPNYNMKASIIIVVLKSLSFARYY